MEGEDEVVYRDAFLGTIQKHRRILQAIRFPLVITFCRSAGNISTSGLRNLLQAVYCDHGSINIISQSEQKMMIMFSEDHDARLAYQELHNQTIEDGNGPVLQFKIWNPIDELGYDIADHHIYVSIKGLPQHLWKRDVVEQILHPFCALGHLSEETTTRRNLSSYTAFAWSQKRIAMPRRISLKVNKEISGISSLTETEDYMEVAVYTLLIDSIGYLCDMETHCSCNLEDLNIRYEATYEPNNAQCFLTEKPDNMDLLNELSYAVVATASHEDHGYQKEEVQDMIANYLGCSMTVHMMNETQFIILPLDTSVGHTAKEILLQKGTLTMSLTTFSIHSWKPNNMSTVQRLNERVSITVNQIPAHLCTPRIIRFVLSPYCAPDSSNQPSQIMITSETFTCAAWTNSTRKIPKRIMAALFLKAPDAEQMEDGYQSTDLRITQLIIDKIRTGAQQAD